MYVYIYIMYIYIYVYISAGPNGAHGCATQFTFPHILAIFVILLSTVMLLSCYLCVNWYSPSNSNILIGFFWCLSNCYLSCLEATDMPNRPPKTTVS